MSENLSPHAPNEKFSDWWKRLRKTVHYVYTLKDREGNALYVGQTADLRHRMWEHYACKSWVCTEVASVEVEELDSAELAQGREAELYHQLKPRYNQIPVYGNRL